MTQPATRAARPSAVALTGVSEEPLSVDRVLDAVRHPGAGGLVVFLGTVREQDHDQAVVALDYTAHPSAVEAMARVAGEVADAHPGTTLAVVHRSGHLVVGDLAVVAAASAAHRGDAFAACRALIDTVKTSVPIWKHQSFADGTDEWVGSR